MNLLTMIEEPVAASARLLPWVVSTHVKDGGILTSPEGLLTFPVPVGDGIVDLATIIARLAELPRQVTLSVEDHGGSFKVPIRDEEFLSRFPDLDHAELEAILALASQADSKPACRPLERDAWPAACESRLARDLAALRTLATSRHVHAGTARPEA